MTMNGAASLAPGFDDPIADAQSSFRALLQVMSHPGRIAEIAAARQFKTVPGLSAAAAATALSLCDLETPVWLDPACAAAAEWLRFHCGSPIVDDPSLARFAFAAGIASLPPLQRFELGSDEFPDRSTTLVLEVGGLAQGGKMGLTGPGIETAEHLGIDGPDTAFWAQRAELGVLFPRGLDLILTCGTRAAALPRTTRVEA
jgi:alpha-D-ribose 1-methylphosphonate 5-triphosphate synthase subunit PhnH